MNSATIERRERGSYRFNGKWYMSRQQAIHAAAKYLATKAVAIEETFDVTTNVATITVKAA